MSQPIRTSSARVTGRTPAFCWSKDLPPATARSADGRRQILSFHIAGDFIDLQSFLLSRLDHSIGTLTAVRVAMFSHAQHRRTDAPSPHLTRLLWRETLIDGRDLPRVDRQCRAADRLPARRPRLLRTRHPMEAVGLARDGDLRPAADRRANSPTRPGSRPCTSTASSRSCGARTSSRSAAGRSRRSNWAGLKIAAEFDASYLQLETRPPDRHLDVRTTSRSAAERYGVQEAIMD